MKKKLYRVKVKDKSNKEERTLYVVSDSMMSAAKMLVDEISVEEEMIDISEVSRECYV